MNPPLDLTISLVNTENRELLASCLRSLPAACAGLRWQVRVVDNASTDGSPELVARDFPEAILLRNERRLGFAANHNQVINAVLEDGSARYVLILNEDTELDPDSMHRLVEFCDANPRVAAAGPAIRGRNGLQQPSWFSFPRFWTEALQTIRSGQTFRTPTANGWLNASCMLVRSEALRAVGSLDERFFIFFEDTDLGMRLHRAGWKSGLCAAATILHHGHSTVAQPALGSAMERQMVRSQYLLFRKHRGAFSAGALSGLFRLVLLARALKAAAEGVVSRKATEREQARLLLDLASYNPREVLAHELAARNGTRAHAA